MEDINEQTLEKLGIFELRNFAREIGVHSPTTLKKNELVEKVMRIVNGIDEPCEITKQGRPPKSINSIGDFMNVFIPQKLYENKKEKINQTYAVLNDNEIDYSSTEIGSNEFNFAGFIQVQADRSYSLCFKDVFTEEIGKVIFISKIQTNFYQLKTGDYVTGKYIKIDDNNPLMLKEIYSINETPFTPNKAEVEDFYNKKAILPNEKIKMKLYKEDDEIFGDIDLFTPLARGQRVLLKSKNNTLFNYKLLHRISSGENNLKGLAILIDESPENYYEISSNLNFTIISNNYNQGGDFDLELEAKVNHLLRLVENGNDVVLFLNDINKFVNFIQQKNILLKKSKDESQILAEEKLKNLILLGRNFEKGSLTVVTSVDFNNYTFDNIFNNVIFYYNFCYEFRLIKENSFTMNIDNILSKAELAKLKSILLKK